MHLVATAVKYTEIVIENFENHPSKVKYLKKLSCYKVKIHNEKSKKSWGNYYIRAIGTGAIGFGAIGIGAIGIWGKWYRGKWYRGKWYKGN